jgi:anti-sigma-K factor RskA
MSAPGSIHDPRDCGADVAGYVLGALDSVEADHFRRHVSGCVVCRDEVAALQASVDALPMAAPQLRTPRSLKRRTLARIRPEPSRAANAHGPLRRGPLAVGGLLAATALTLCVLQLAPSGASGIRSVPAAAINQGQFASAVLHVESGHAELLVSHMPAPPAGKIYEVWLKHSGEALQPTSALFGVTSSGAGTVDVPGSLSGVSEVLVTPEPIGGSRVPTHAPVIVASLAG